MSALFNSASLILGFAAWILAIAAIVKPDRRCFPFISFTACILSLVFQILEINHRVNIGDFSAIMDTIGAVVLASVVMSSVTVILNLSALFRAEVRISKSGTHQTGCSKQSTGGDSF